MSEYISYGLKVSNRKGSRYYLIYKDDIKLATIEILKDSIEVKCFKEGLGTFSETSFKRNAPLVKIIDEILSDHEAVNA